MRRNSRTPDQAPMWGSPVWGAPAELGRKARRRAGARMGRVDWPRLRHSLYIIGGGIAATLLASSLPARQRGAWPAITGIATLLALTWYRNRHQVGLTRTLFVAIPLSIVLGLALATTPLTRGPARNTSKLSTQASTIGAGAVVDTGSGLGTAALDFAKDRIDAFLNRDKPRRAHAGGR